MCPGKEQKRPRSQKPWRAPGMLWHWILNSDSNAQFPLGGANHLPVRLTLLCLSPWEFLGHQRKHGVTLLPVPTSTVVAMSQAPQSRDKEAPDRLSALASTGVTCTWHWVTSSHTAYCPPHPQAVHHPGT